MVGIRPRLIGIDGRKDLPTYGFCGCKYRGRGRGKLGECTTYGLIIPDLYDCSGRLICEVCIKGLCEIAHRSVSEIVICI